MKYIIATHGYLADGYVSSIQVLTKKNNIYAVNAYVDDRDAALQLKTIIESFENQEEIIIFTDLMCGSMTQAVAPYLDRYNVRCITGINLPLILEFVLTTSTIDDTYSGSAETDGVCQSPTKANTIKRRTYSSCIKCYNFVKAY